MIPKASEFLDTISFKELPTCNPIKKFILLSKNRYPNQSEELFQKIIDEIDMNLKVLLYQEQNDEFKWKIDDNNNYEFSKQEKYPDAKFHDDEY
jgi:hypothetical protein